MVQTVEPMSRGWRIGQEVHVFPLRIQRLMLADIGPIAGLDLAVRSDTGMTLICGDNGIGKSTILEALAAPFAQGGPQRLRKRSGTASGSLRLVARHGDAVLETSASVSVFEPEANIWAQMLQQHASGVINVRASRDFSYQRREAITRDPQFSDEQSSARVSAGLDANEIKQWFSNRYLMRPHGDEGGWTRAMRANLTAAESFLSILDPSVELKGVNVRSFEIEVSTPSGVVPFEYLSSGFRSAYVLLLGIMKEIEYRGLDVSNEEFAGVILIDELDLHLHPTWQRRIANVMTQAFPRAQIIATTHSPHIIQAADASEVVALGRNEDGWVARRPLPSATYGYAGWTLDEVLEDVMGVPDTKSPEYRAVMERFDRALEREDAVATAETLARLRDMLHPGNPHRKLLAIQAAPILGNHE